jgi:hypothetical protein
MLLRSSPLLSGGSLRPPGRPRTHRKPSPGERCGGPATVCPSRGLRRLALALQASSTNRHKETLAKGGALSARVARERGRLQGARKGGRQSRLRTAPGDGARCGCQARSTLPCSVWHHPTHACARRSIPRRAETVKCRHADGAPAREWQHEEQDCLVQRAATTGSWMSDQPRPSTDTNRTNGDRLATQPVSAQARGPPSGLQETKRAVCLALSQLTARWHGRAPRTKSLVEPRRCSGADCARSIVHGDAGLPFHP